MNRMNIQNFGILIVTVLFLFSCKKKEIIPTVSSVAEIYLDSDANSRQMLKDDEPLSVMISDARNYKIAKVIRVKAINSTTIEIANFAPIDITDVTILINLNNNPKAIQLFKIKKLRAHALQEIRYPFLDGNPITLDVDGNTVDMTLYKMNGIPVNEVASFDFDGQNNLIQKLKLLKNVKWGIDFQDFNSTDDPTTNWKIDPTPQDFRRYTALLLNYAFFLSDSITRNEFVAEPITDNNGVFLTTIQKQNLFSKYAAIPNFQIGVVVNVAGLGGGSIFGLTSGILQREVNGIRGNTSTLTPIHEMGHMLGFSHSSSMTYQNNGQGATNAIRKATLLLNLEAPIQPNTYYKQTDL